MKIRNNRGVWLGYMLLAALFLPAVMSPPALATTIYVSPGAGDTPPYTNWETAASSLQAAIDTSVDGDVVLVSNGVYNVGQVLLATNVASRIAITNAIIVQSVNGPDSCRIEGDNLPTRCVYVGTNAQLIGFTLAGGYTDPWLPTIPESSGGGVMCEGGLVLNCRITNNRGVNGGGVLCYNGGTIRNCLIVSNRCNSSGGGVFVYNGGNIENCTITTNFSSANGGGLYCQNGGTVVNTIIFRNSATVSGTNWIVSGSNTLFTYTCTTPLAAGAGNFLTNPMFTNPAAGDYHLQLGSPCIDKGTNIAWMTNLILQAGNLDFDSNTRIMNTNVDLGCYEYLYYSILSTATTNGSIAPAGTRYVARGANTNYIISATTPHYHVADVQVDGIPVGPSNTYTFVNVTTNHTINADFAIDTFTIVVTNDHGTAVPSGTTTNNWGTTNVCTITDSPIMDGTTQYLCSGWTGTGFVPTNGALTNVNVVVTTNATLTWNWTTNYWLDISTADTNGSVNVTSRWCRAFTNVTVTATPTSGYHFVNWTGDITSTNNPIVVTMTNPFAITANFAINIYNITATAGTNGSIFPTGTVQYAYGDTTNYVIAADTNYHVWKVMVDGTNVGAVTNYTFAGISSNHTIDAQFTIDTYKLTVATPYGTAVPTGVTTNDYGTNVFCSITNSPFIRGTTQYVCLGWVGSGSTPTSGIGTNVTVTMTNDSTLTWLWMTNYWLHCVAVPASDGSVDVGDSWQSLGSTVTVTATPASKAYFSGWTGTIPPGSATNNPLTLVMTNTLSVTGNFVVTTHYVSPTGSNVAPYTSWGNAATNIQDAVDVSVMGERVLVTNGVYSLVSPLVVTNGIRVQSVNGPDYTTIDGNEAVRCVYSGHSSNILDGFTVTRGLGDKGGGVELLGGIIRNCIVQGNTAGRGGGVSLSYGALMQSCMLSGNFAQLGAGAYVDSTGIVQNCTVVSNTAYGAGGGLYSIQSAMVQNSIIYFNAAPAWTNFFATNGLAATNNCTFPLIVAGNGNITNDPQVTPSFRFKTNSPCIDAGTAAGGAPLTDIYGKPRWDHPGHPNSPSTTDMGACEFTDVNGNGIDDNWELQQFGTLTNTAVADNDGDGLTNLQEYNNALCPTNKTTFYDTLNDSWKATYGFTQPHVLKALVGYECTRVGGYDTTGTAYGVEVSGSYAYVADGTGGLQVVNISVPTNCTRVGGYDTAGTSYGVQVAAPYAYVADGTNGLQIINVAVPASCTLTGGYVPPGTAYGVCINGSYAYLADGTNGLQIINVTVPAACTLTGGYVTNGTAYGVYVSGTTAYVAYGTNGLQIVDVSTPATCSNVGAFVTGGDVRGVIVSNSLAYVSDLTNGLVVVDVSVPSNCTRVGGCYVFGAAKAALVGTNVYMASGWGLDVLDTNAASGSGHAGRCFINDTANDVKVSGGYAYVATGSNGLHVINVQVLDSDQDGLPDSWETNWWGNLAQTAAGDPDVDLISNWGEYLIGSNPKSADTDGDGVSDWMEVNFTFTDPRRADTDGDGWVDGVELAQGTDPRDPASFPAFISGTVFYAGIQTGTIRVVVTNSASSTNISLGAPGAYSVTNRHTLTNHYVSAYVDVNGNGVRDAWEAFGSYSNNPVTLTNNTGGIDITLVDPQYSYLVNGNPSLLGAPLPYGYTTTNLSATRVVTNSVALHVIENGNGRTQYICTGWTGTGSVLASGVSTTVTVTVTNNSSITWNWQPELYYITIQSDTNGSAGGTSGWYRAGSLLTNVVSASNGYHFAGWTGDVPPANTNDTTLVLSVNQARSIMVNFSINTYAITSSASANGTIAPVGVVQVAYGGSTNFVITPAAHYHVVDVQVDGLSVGVTNAWIFSNVATSHTINADFAIDMYSITATAGANGNIAPAGVVPVPWNGATNFVMTANPTYYVKDVLVDAVSVGAVTSYTFNAVATNHVIGVQFDDKYALTVSTPYGAAVPSGLGMYKYGTNVICGLTNSPVLNGTTQYVCTGWTGTGSVPASGVGTSVVVTVTNTSTLSWAWATNYWLHAVAGTNGSIDTGDGWVAAGQTVTLTATPTNHYNFVNWTGSMTSTNNPLVLSMSQAHSVTANFAIVTYGVTATAGPNGSIVPSGVVQVPYDGTTNFDIAASANYHITNVIVDGTSIGVTNIYTFANVTNLHTIDAYFGVDMYNLTVTSPLGTPSPSGVNTYGWLTPLTCTVLDSPIVMGMTQLACIGWTGTGSVPASGVGTNASFTFTTNSTLAWNWQTYYLLNATAGSFGSVTASNGWRTAGEVVTLTATPTNNYHFTGWTGTLSSTNNPLTLTMDGGVALTANFTIDTYTITATAEANGTISPSGTVTVAYGASTNFVIGATPYHYVSNVVVDGVSIGATNQYTFFAVSTNHTISVGVGTTAMPLVVVSAYGTATPAAGTNSFGYNTLLSCSVAGSPVTNGTTQYVCIGWTGSGSVPVSGVGTNASFSITNSSVLTWQWRTNYWLHTAAQTNGTVDVGDGWYRAGTNVTITATPLPGYWFSSWTGDVAVADIAKNPLTLTMSGPRAVTAQFALSPYYVSTQGRHIWPYTSWQNAATNIQAAVNVAGNGRLVLVSNGTYVVSATVTITNGITMQSVNGAGSTVIDGNSAVRCLYISHSNAVISGFTIAHGRRTGDGNGGGVMIKNGGTLASCTISGNSATNYGGGVYCLGTGAVLNCTITGNSSWYGGGVQLESVGAFMTGCTINNNSAGFGGGVRLRNGGAITNCTINNNVGWDSGGGLQTVTTGYVRGCTFIQNTASNYGGGVYCYLGGTVTNCTISNNKGFYGGGVQCEGGGTVDNSIISGNQAYYGGGARCKLGGVVRNCQINNNSANTGGGLQHVTSGTAVNCVFSGNVATNAAGGVWCYQGGTVENCVISGNSAGSAGGGLKAESGGSIYNTIIQFNGAGTGTNYVNAGAGMLYSYCCTVPAVAGPGNITGDPLFLDLSAADFHLRPGSPCIDSGTNRAWMTTAVDLDGNPRLSCYTVDRGVYEWVDTDRDGLSDWAETNIYGTDPNNPDTDGDGMSDGAEVIAGTSPLLAGDVLKVTDLAKPAAAGFVMTWQSQTGRVYSIQCTRTLVPSAWSNIPAFVERLGNGGLMSWTNSVFLDPQDFYKVGVRLGP